MDGEPRVRRARDSEAASSALGAHSPALFREKVWSFVRSVPPGRVVTYGQVAAHVGAPFAARAVGAVLHSTPGSAEVPCQRVVNRWGRLAPTYGWGGMDEHRRELEAEGIEVRPDHTVDLALYQWWPEPAPDESDGSGPGDSTSVARV